LYLYAGAAGFRTLTSLSSGATFNGGGGFVDGHPDHNNSTGAGASDVRLANGAWDNFNSLKSRIMVAAGAGGSISPVYWAPYAGGLESPKTDGGEKINGNEYIVVDGATQTSGYAFGIGQTATEKDLAGYARSGGGGGYYGGYGKWCSGSGGSSFVSGHPGCNAISASSTNTNIIHTGQPNHYSGYKFTETEMKGGNESVKEPDGTFNKGHLGSGVIKITWHPAL
jgi:hypothetical protein